MVPISLRLRLKNCFLLINYSLLTGIDNLSFLQIPQILERFKVSTRLRNPWKSEGRAVRPNTDKEMLLALMNMTPGLQEKSARALLDRFRDVRGVAGASEAELAQAVGPRLARGLHNFLTRKNTV